MALALLLLLGIPLLLVGLVVLLRDGRPVLFAQERVGRNGRRFRILKFRTMAVARRLLQRSPPGKRTTESPLTADSCAAGASMNFRS